jgi:CRISPR-associated protein Cas1
MIKQTLYFGNPAYLSLKNKQMAIRLLGVDKKTIRPQFNAMTSAYLWV